MSASMTPVIAAHGVAWDWDADTDAAKADGLRLALAIGQAILADGGSALDAVQATVEALENDERFDAACGGFLNRDGLVQTDALIACGTTRDLGAVAGLTRIRNPIALARKVLTDPDFCMFVGADAERYAVNHAIALIENEELQIPAMVEHHRQQSTDGARDTVGAIALDAEGRMAVAGSTSGTPYKPAGRVGDTVMWGAGAYVEDGLGAAIATGMGEDILRERLAGRIADAIATRGVEMACDEGMAAFLARRPTSWAGVVAMDPSGKVSTSQTAPKMACGWIQGDGAPHIQMTG